VDRPRVIGLTGGIASGKSAVAAMLRDLGAVVIDADALGHQVIAPGQPAHAEVVREFGAEVLAADGSIDRRRLGALVFADPERLRRLEAISHPRIVAAAEAAFAAAAAAGARLVIFEAAILVERRLCQGLDGLIVVAVDPETQVARVMARDHLDQAAARARLAAQLPLAAKLALADQVIDNSGTLAATRAQVERLWRELEGER
jgi:dephospho-CoA kinase